MAKADIKDKWKEDWSKEEERENTGLQARGLGIHYRKVTGGSIPFSFKPRLPAAPRKHQSAYIQLKLGIGYLRPFLKRAGKRESDLCDECEVKEDTEHLVLYCTRYNQERTRMKKALETLPLTLQALFCTEKGKAALAEYLISTKICTREWSG